MRPGPAGERHPSSLLHQARFLIANLELEIQITAAFSGASIFLIANILRFLALRREGFVLHFRAMPLSQILIETPRLKLRISGAISITSNFLIETKRRFCIPNASAFRCLLASSSPNL